MRNYVEMSKAEDLLINLCSPAIYLLALRSGGIPFREITNSKRNHYTRIVREMKGEAQLPDPVLERYSCTLCGLFSTGVAHLRKVGVFGRK
ncbi:MAG: hypothetical protein ABH864_00220 [archaeon]